MVTCKLFSFYKLSQLSISSAFAAGDKDNGWPAKFEAELEPYVSESVLKKPRVDIKSRSGDMMLPPKADDPRNNDADGLSAHNPSVNEKDSVLWPSPRGSPDLNLASGAIFFLVALAVLVAFLVGLKCRRMKTEEVVVMSDGQIYRKTETDETETNEVTEGEPLNQATTPV